MRSIKRNARAREKNALQEMLASRRENRSASVVRGGGPGDEKKSDDEEEESAPPPPPQPRKRRATTVASSSSTSDDRAKRRRRIIDESGDEDEDEEIVEAAPPGRQFLRLAAWMTVPADSSTADAVRGLFDQINLSRTGLAVCWLAINTSGPVAGVDCVLQVAAAFGGSARFSKYVT